MHPNINNIHNHHRLCFYCFIYTLHHCNTNTCSLSNYLHPHQPTIKMLSACLSIIRSADAALADKLLVSNIKIRIAIDTTHEQVDAQIKQAFGLDASSMYELSNDDMLCALPSVVQSLNRWLLKGDGNAPLEYDGVIQNSRATVTCAMKVSSQSTTAETTGTRGTTTTTTFVSPGSTNAGETKARAHKEWEKDCLQVS